MLAGCIKPDGIWICPKTEDTINNKPNTKRQKYLDIFITPPGVLVLKVKTKDIDTIQKV